MTLRWQQQPAVNMTLGAVKMPVLYRVTVYCGRLRTKSNIFYWRRCKVKYTMIHGY